MSVNDFIKNIVTLGAHGRVQDAVDNCNKQVASFNRHLRQIKAKKSETEETLKILISAKIRAISSLEKIQMISKNISVREREFIEHKINCQTNFNFSSIQSTVDSGKIAMKGLKGASAGIGSATGAWALAGWIGTASTGTTISTLTGVAATNATLAWLGGGAISVGGLGTAGGTVILGGIVALPILIFVGFGAHISASNEIKKITKKETDVIIAINECKKALNALDLLSKRSREITDSIKAMEDVFDQEFKKIHKKLFPSFWTKPFKRIRSWFGSDYFTKDELKIIAYIGKCASELAILVDTPILDNNGKLV